ncbi:MAG: histidine triad nucleotide-binding protein [Acidobacteriaceae bacterium]
MDCLFCKIISGEIPAKVLHRDASCVAFHDISPGAPTHFLVIPRKHIASLAEVDANDEPLLGHMIGVAAELAAANDMLKGFRVVINTGADGGQTVHHLHAHVLGGRAMHWPPG